MLQPWLKILSLLILTATTARVQYSFVGLVTSFYSIVSSSDWYKAVPEEPIGFNKARSRLCRSKLLRGYTRIPESGISTFAWPCLGRGPLSRHSGNIYWEDLPEPSLEKVSSVLQAS